MRRERAGGGGANVLSAAQQKRVPFFVCFCLFLSLVFFNLVEEKFLFLFFVEHNQLPIFSTLVLFLPAGVRLVGVLLGGEVLSRRDDS